MTMDSPSDNGLLSRRRRIALMFPSTSSVDMPARVDITCSASPNPACGKGIAGTRARWAWREMHRPLRVVLRMTPTGSAPDGARQSPGRCARLLGMGERQHHHVRMRQNRQPAGYRPTGIAMEHRRAGGKRAGMASTFCASASSSRCATPAWRRISLTVRPKLARAASTMIMVSISRRLRGDLDFFSLGWLNDAAGAAQEPGNYIVMADQGSGARPC